MTIFVSFFCRHRFLLDLGGILAPTWRLTWAQVDPKTDRQIDPSWRVVLIDAGPFFIQSCPQRNMAEVRKVPYI